VQADYDEATGIGLPGTPFLVINNRPYQGPRDYTNLAAIIRLFHARRISSIPNARKW
jgi:protein-disulfide isomerase